MIEINLSPKATENSLANVGGLNLSLLNVKMIILSIVLYYTLPSFVLDHYTEQMTILNAQETKIRSEQRKTSGKLRNLEGVKKQVEDLNRQETALTKRIQAVKIIVDKRENPFKVYKYIAENTPGDVWITEMEIDNKRLKIIGRSKDWKSIGVFLENLKSSIFFDPNGTTFDRPPSVDSAKNGQRIESFRITAMIKRYE